MKVGLVGVVFVALLFRAKCDNYDEMKARMDAMEKRQEVMEKRFAKMDAIEKNQEDMQKQLVVMDQQQQGKVKGNGYIFNHY